jgi:pteridine reductase
MVNQRLSALVTGGAKRVGRQICLRLAEAGYDVAFTYHKSEKDAAELVELLRGRGAKGAAISADLTQPAAAVDLIAREVERVDVLVNNASIYVPGGLRDFSGPDAKRMWAVHVEAPLLLCRAFEKQLRANRGHVVNMLDLMVERPMPAYMSYCTSKAALWNLTLSLARELAPQATVNGIAPGVVEWPADFPEADREKYLSRVPLGRAGTPEDVSKAVLFFCAQGSYVTGQVLRLDGGRSLT